jgi:molybdopterin-guanine dinucleotide biosynthesis protein A
MIKLDGMLMIGSAGANVGKTELACELIRKFGQSTDIVGIKVTAIKEKDGQCPRGGFGCGVCSSLEGDFCITEEKSSKSGKDTARLLAAGAGRVFWLRVLKSHLKEGLAALLDIIGHNAISVCESNSLRLVVEPGLFLVVKGHNSKIWKSTAEDVKEYADKIVISNGNRFGLDRIKLTDGRWLLQENATAIIMAGGSSSRMGTDKSILPLEGKPMIERICERLHGTFSRILISAGDTDKFAFLDERVVTDKVPGQGPLMGIASALQISDNELNFVVACDIPHVNLPLVRRMLVEAEDVDIVVPVNRDGKYEPLFAVYRKSTLAAINDILACGGRKISDVFGCCKVKYIELDDSDWLMNINTMAEYKEYREKCDGT